jgi:hypothetical protein
MATIQEPISDTLKRLSRGGEGYKESFSMGVKPHVTYVQKSQIETLSAIKIAILKNRVSQSIASRTYNPRELLLHPI